MAIPPISTALAGVPPVGVGVYDPTRRRPDSERWAFRAVHPTRAHARDWAFLGPSSWERDNWRASLDALVLHALRNPLCPGIVPDPEGGIVQLPSAERSSVLREMGRRFARAAITTRVIVTSHGGFPIGELARYLSRAVVGSPQLYYDGATNARVWARWRDAFGRRLIPSIAGPRGIARPREGWDTPDGYARYLDTIPHDVTGVMVWDLTPMPQHALDAIHARWGLARGLAIMPLVVVDTWLGLALALFALAALAITLTRS